MSSGVIELCYSLWQWSMPRYQLVYYLEEDKNILASHVKWYYCERAQSGEACMGEEGTRPAPWPRQRAGVSRSDAIAEATTYYLRWGSKYYLTPSIIFCTLYFCTRFLAPPITLHYQPSTSTCLFLMPNTISNVKY